MIKKTLLLTCTALLLNVGQANDLYGVGYTIIGTQSIDDDMIAPVYKQIEAHNVQHALEQLLIGTGWRLADIQNADPQISRLYSQPFPIRKKIIGPMPLDEALMWVSGSAWSLVVDPVNRLVSFEVSQEYQCLPSVLEQCP